MALDQSALLELLEALKGADVDDRVRQAAGTIYQALIEAELTAVVGAGRHERRCRVHFLRNVLAAVPKGNAEMARLVVPARTMSNTAARTNRCYRD